jgi:hypothetical protein
MSSADLVHFQHRLTVVAEPDPAVLARIVAPFVIHDVRPSRLAATLDVSGTNYVVTVEFDGPPGIAERLAARIAAMPCVCALACSDATAMAA